MDLTYMHSYEDKTMISELTEKLIPSISAKNDKCVLVLPESKNVMQPFLQVELSY